MASNAQGLIAQFNAMITLIDNFPMSILDRINTKRYDSVFEFLLDLMAAVGISPETVIIGLIEEITNKTMPEIRDDVQGSINDYIENLELPQSAFLEKIEEHSKGILFNIITSLASCSAIPIIPSYHKDERGFNIPINVIDYGNILTVNPLGKEGNLYYAAKNKNVVNQADLWQTFDGNAFLWYVMNASSDINQSEENKTVWDSRRPAYRKGLTIDTNNNITWINRGNKNEAYNGDASDEKHRSYYPILNLKRTGYETLHVSFPSERYGSKATVYQFNSDYLSSIKIFDPKVILTSMVEQFFGFRLSNVVNLGIERTVLEKKIDEVIIKVLEEDEGTVSDCYYEFSNDEYDSMLQENLYQRYNAKKYGADGIGGVAFDTDSIIKQLEEINSDSISKVEKQTKLKKLLQDVTVTPGTPGSSSVGLRLDYNTNWWRDMLRAITLPIARSLLSPQVMLLVEINLLELGLINLDDIKNNPDKLTAFIITKILAMLESIIRYIKDLIVNYLISVIQEKVTDIILKYIALVALESLTEYKQLLEDALACITIPIFKSRERPAGIDDVQYADIVKEQNIPESETNC